MGCVSCSFADAFCVRAAAVLRAAGCIGSALPGGALLSVATKVTKNACPYIRPCASLRVRYSLRSPFGPAFGCYFATLRFAPSPFQGHAAKGHPWPIASLAASMPLNPFRNDSVRPPEGGVWSCLKVLYSFPDHSHALRGNPSRDAPRHWPASTTKQAIGA